MGELNLDDLRAARAEALGEKHAVTFGGKRYDLPPRAPLGLLEHLGAYAALQREEKAGDPDAGDASLPELFAAAEELLGTAGWRRFKRAGAELADVLDLLTGALRLYGLGSVGEPQASGSTPSDTGGSSRPTSRVSTLPTTLGASSTAP